MHVCTQCAASVDLSRLGKERQSCPDCGGQLRVEPGQPWTDVARVRNLAEAGFLCDELLGLARGVLRAGEDPEILIFPEE